MLTKYLLEPSIILDSIDDEIEAREVNDLPSAT